MIMNIEKGDNERIEKLVFLLFACIVNRFFVPLHTRA